MKERQRVFLLILIMATASLTVAGVTISMLYRAALREQQTRLLETAQSQARLIEAIARHEAVYEKDRSEEATLAQIMDAHENYKGFGKTGEFSLAKREGDHIVFLFSHRYEDLIIPEPIRFDAGRAEPMRRALSGLSGVVVGLDYRGKRVLAAHEPVAGLNRGIVVKIDVAEIREPFLRAGSVAGGSAIFVVFIGTLLFIRISRPMIRRLEEYSKRLEAMVNDRTEELKMANEQLGREIEERKRVEVAIRESEEHLRHLSSQLLEVQESERKRVGKELHDTVAQTLAAIKVNLERKIEGMDPTKAPSGILLEDLISMVQKDMEEVRRIIMELRPSILDDLGLLATINWLCREYQTLHQNIRIDKRVKVEETEIPDTLKIVILRVMQEALGNAVKHSKAELVKISLRRVDSKIELTIQDNGEGFDIEEVSSRSGIMKGLGLSSMRERTVFSKGLFSIESIPGKGTFIRASWPR
ncbi:MAG: hypothetical protein GTN81_11585 [Proteobacteria bacterium]|nr:hypothetical protein [Pseudomonadota bacterium]